MQPLQDRVNLGTMVMKEYSVFPKAPALLESHHQIVECHIQDTRWWEVLFYRSADWAKTFVVGKVKAHSTVSRWLKKFDLACKNVDDQARSGRPKIVDSEAVLQALDANLASNPRTVSGELDIWQSNVVGHLHDLHRWKELLNCASR